MAEKAYITPKVLKWARESAKMSLEEAASKVNKSAEQLSAWEEGEEFPTIRQAEKLAKSYKRPFALFFLPEIPNDFQPLQDFRKSDSKNLTTGSIFIIREIQQKQNWLSEVMEESGESKLSFIGKFSLNNSPTEVAEDIIKTLGISRNMNGQESSVKYWVDQIEANGIFVSRTSFIHSRLLLDKDELQGFAIADPYAPFVFVNSQDWDAPQLFTLIHELAHLWIAETGISNDVEMDSNNSNPIERFCNEVAASVLMPEELIKSFDYRVYDNSKSVFRTAKTLGVSSFALIVRALNLSIISFDHYQTLKAQVQNDFNEFLVREEEKKQKAKQREGGPNPYLLRVNKNSRLFTQLVLDAFRGGNIEPTQASTLLNTSINNFSKLELQIYK
ncbi:ImmA/IrrE family metallo-endopeptidase [Reichenbachiella ulvae]|uniref:ImmA/IrrE family metallo-endopeptidase n=1 Tax=Reichenbachiella ulvae TaxID=2980104 RepID=A0ABT3CZG0_9BACT|nr:ImmA/IrrE family metallo-endopeptidase [Reichenbachiella ulvae]MCV9388943.1 ImmA/IrrE family metallo-endopeptidase [Reichenbachiella ulvae]